MSTSKDTEQKAAWNKETGDEIVNAARMAVVAFDGISLPDSELQELCEAALNREAERKMEQDAKRMSR